MMRKAIRSVYALALTLVVAAGCSTSEQGSPPSATAPSITLQPTTEPTSTSQPTSTGTVVTPTILPTESLTPAMPLFSESGGIYLVNLTATDFVDVVDTPYFPTVSAGDQIVEDTYDWFAQDKYGNVWYVGEAVDNYIAGVLVNHSGSWEWGVDGAQPGIIMWADPSAHLDEKYRQEDYAGKAEDMGQVLAVDESLTVPFGSFEQVVKTLDFSKIETAQEQKFYAPGIGLVKEMDVNGGEEVVLTSFTQP